MSYIDATGALNIGTKYATAISMGGAAPITFTSGSTCDFTNATITNFAAPLIGATTQVVYHNGTGTVGISSMTFNTATTTLTVPNVVATGVQIGSAGTNGAPTFGFTSSTNTGMYNNARGGPSFAVGVINRILTYVTVPLSSVSGTVIPILSITISSGQHIGAIIEYLIEAKDTVNLITEMGTCLVSASNNVGVFTMNITATPISTPYFMAVGTSTAGSMPSPFTTFSISGASTPLTISCKTDFGAILAGSPTVTIYYMIRSMPPTSTLIPG